MGKSKKNDLADKIIKYSHLERILFVDSLFTCTLSFINNILSNLLIF